MGISLGGVNSIADQSTPAPSGAGKGGGAVQQSNVQPGIYEMMAQAAQLQPPVSQMQPQQYMQMPYAQQYAQQGNINDPTVFAALQALNAPALIAQPTQRYGSGILDQPTSGKGGAVGSAPMVQDWRTMRDQIAARTPAVTAPVTSSDGGGGDMSYGSGDSSSGIGQGVSNSAADAGLAMMGYPAFAPYGPAVNAIGYGIAGQQADAMGAAAENLGAIQAADQLGVMSVSDPNGNTFSAVTPGSIAAADAAFFGLGDVSGSSDSSGQGTGVDGGYGAGGFGAGDDFGGFGSVESGGYGANIDAGVEGFNMGNSFGNMSGLGFGGYGSDVGTIGLGATNSSSNDSGAADSSGQGTSVDGGYGAGGFGAGDDFGGFGASTGSGNDGGGGGGDGGKIICTAMNHAYGFGSFRNAIWIAYSDKHLTKAHEVGYHTLFLPLVDFGFKRGDAKPNLAVRKILEWGTRHRSMDIRAEMRGTKRDKTGQAIRFVFEPLCLIVGKLKGY